MLWGHLPDAGGPGTPACWHECNRCDPGAVDNAVLCPPLRVRRENVWAGKRLPRERQASFASHLSSCRTKTKSVFAKSANSGPASVLSVKSLVRQVLCISAEGQSNCSCCHCSEIHHPLLQRCWYSNTGMSSCVTWLSLTY